ncbi:hypothetical protein RHCRD62_20044 [Rhodococcus sp. RD6.2]|nr:hypothetical protein RHCRD62_20044 [Rhodococcus sp. RD6.2]
MFHEMRSARKTHDLVCSPELFGAGWSTDRRPCLEEVTAVDEPPSRLSTRITMTDGGRRAL